MYKIKWSIFCLHFEIRSKLLFRKKEGWGQINKSGYIAKLATIDKLFLYLTSY